MTKKTIYLCDLCPTDEDGNQPEVNGAMMYTIKLSTPHQGTEATVEIDACQACKDRFFKLKGV